MSVASNSSLDRTSTHPAGRLCCESSERAEAAQLKTLGGPTRYD